MTLGSKFRFIARNALRPIIGWKNWNALQFRFLHGYKPNFSKPSTFLEYLQYLKYYGGAGELAPFVDKLHVKHFVRERIGNQYVIPTAKVVYPNEEVSFSNLPPRWIAKSAHAAGWNHIQDGGPIDDSLIRTKISRWLRRNYYSISGETNYRYIMPKVIFEPLISDLGEDLKDYKIWCFNGEPLLVGVHGDRKSEPKGQILQLNWEPSAWIYPDIPRWEVLPDKPSNLELLLALARELSRGFPFVRVDLYDGNRGVYFGEMTFTPGDGNNIRIPKNEDFRIGQKILSCERPVKLTVNFETELRI